MIGTELGDLRRTHYSTELNSLNEGTDVTVMGWVVTVRGHGNIVFATIRDKLGNIQVITKSGECEDDIREKLSHLKEHSSIAVVGKTRKNEKSPTGIEIVPSEMRVFSEVEKIPPFEPYAKTVKNIDTRLEVRAIDLRRNVLQKIFLARSVTLRALRDYLGKEDFVEVNTPKMIATATEGGAALFPIFYYNKEAFLAQSPQLYKEQMTIGLERVFEISSFYRAEKSHTGRHLSEFTSVDIEAAMMDYTDVMDVLESIVVDVFKNTAENSKTEQKEIGHEIRIPDSPFERVSYTQALDELGKMDIKLEFGEDLQDSHLRSLGEKHPGFFFLTDWPMKLKPFYIHEKDDDPTLSRSFDLQYGYLELSSGGRRLHDPEQLKSRLKEQNLDPTSFEEHLKTFGWGMPPHSGWGMGLDRLMTVLIGIDNVREVVLYPRDPDRLKP